jgi:hypothetical protein
MGFVPNDWGNCGQYLSNLAVISIGYFSGIWVAVPVVEKQREFQFQTAAFFDKHLLGEGSSYEFIGT